MSSELTFTSEQALKLSAACDLVASGLSSISTLLKEAKQIPVQKGKKRTRREKDPNAPKNAPTGYSLFMAEVRPKLKEDPATAHMTPTEVMTELGRRWKALSDSEKEPYVSESNELKAQHVEEMKSYEASKHTESPMIIEAEEEEESESDNESSASESSEEAIELAPKVVQKAPLVAKPVQKTIEKPVVVKRSLVPTPVATPASVAPVSAPVPVVEKKVKKHKTKHDENVPQVAEVKTKKVKVPKA